MIGAIIGDIVGSRFEFDNYRSKDFELFTEKCFATDDSVMTLAVAKAIMETDKIKGSPIKGVCCDSEHYSLLEKMTVKYMQEIGREYPNCGYGGMFRQWVFSSCPKPYNSFGNGAAMRISPVGFAARTEGEAIGLSKSVTGVTHNHPEGLKGAEAAAVAVFMARCGCTKVELREKIGGFYYPLDFTIDSIRETYRFNETCQGTVPQAIEAFLESSSFEDAIRTAISVGGDSDTLAAITGAIAEAYYGVPDELCKKALTYLDPELQVIYEEWEGFIGDDNSGRFRTLTKYIVRLENKESFGEWKLDDKNDDFHEHPVHMPYVNYNIPVDLFVEEFYQFSDSHPEFELTKYGAILEGNGVKWDGNEMRSADADMHSAQCVLALIMGAIRADRFCEGTLLGFFESGSVLKWLKRLKEIDDGEL